MCTIDAPAAVARYLREHPRAYAGEPPALRGCAGVAWSEIPGFPPEMPALFYGLLDADTAPEASRVLVNVLLASPLHLSAAMPAALPFLLRLAADPAVPARAHLLDLVLVTADMSQPVDATNDRMLQLLGTEHDHPERRRCRAAFVEHAPLLRSLIDNALRDDLLTADDKATLQQATTPH